MKSFRKKIQESRLKMHLLVRSWLQPKLGVIGRRYRLAAKIRLANRWAAKHPKTTFAGVTGTLLLLLVSTVAIDSGNEKQSEPDISSIAAMEPVFQGFRTIQTNKDIHRSALTDIRICQFFQLRPGKNNVITIHKKVFFLVFFCRRTAARIR